MILSLLVGLFIIIPVLIMSVLYIKFLMFLVTIPLIMIILILVAVHLMCKGEIQQGCTKTIICRGSNNDCRISKDGIYIDGNLLKCKCGKKACNIESCGEDLEAYCDDCY